MQTKQGIKSFYHTCIYPKRTNLKYNIWIDDTACEKRETPNRLFQLKYGKSLNECATIDFGIFSNVYPYYSHIKLDEPDIQALFKWINLNYDFLMRYYQDEDYDFVDFIYDMTAVK